MNAKWKQMWVFVLSIALIVSLVACEAKFSDEMESNNPVNSAQQPTDKYEDTNSLENENQANPISLYKTIQKFSNDGTLQETIDCAYDERTSTLICTAVQSGKSYIFEYDSYGRIIDIKSFSNESTPIQWMSYDQDGSEIASIFYNDDGTIYTGHLYQYDEQGNRISFTSWYSNGSYEELEYDKNEKIAKSTSYYVDGAIQSYTRYDYKYDSGNRIIEENRFYSDGHTWKREYKYNSAGNVTKEITYGENENISEWTEYEYNSAGHVIKKTTYDSNGDVTQYFEYEYDTAGNNVKQSYYAKKDTDAVPSLTSTDAMEYDSAGNRVKRISYRPDQTISEEAEFAPEGWPVKDLYYNSDGFLASGYEYTYSSDGTLMKFSMYDDGKLSLEQSYEYEYNSHGNITTMKVIDSLKENELRNVEYKYDAEGNMLSLTAYDSMKNTVTIEYQTISFASNSDYPQFNNSIYNQLSTYDIPMDTSEYYDYLLCTGGGYSIVAKQVETVTDSWVEIGVLDDNYDWVIAMDANTPFHANGQLPDPNGYTHFDSICNQLDDRIHYAGNGIFIYAKPKMTLNGNDYYEAISWNVLENSSHEFSRLLTKTFTLRNGYIIMMDNSYLDSHNGNVVMMNDKGKFVQTDIYCKSTAYLGQYAEGVFFSYDGFYDIGGNLIIDLSNYAGLIINNPTFSNGQCELIAVNPNGVEFNATLSIDGTFISEFSESSE